jgi:hypothetical protein
MILGKARCARPPNRGKEHGSLFAKDRQGSVGRVLGRKGFIGVAGGSNRSRRLSASS